MKIFISIFFILFSQFLFAQREDNTWLLGYNARYFSTSKVLGDSFGNVFMKFTKEGITLKEDDDMKMDLDGQNGSICDKQGNFLFGVDGLSIVNAKAEVLENGDSLFTSFFPQTALILPQPKFEEKLFYVLLAESGYLENKKDIAAVNLYYCVVEWDKQKSTGVVIKRKELLLKDTIGENIVACRHGNGRDWWIMVSEWNTNFYYKFLLTPQGIKLHDKQSIGKVPFSGLSQSAFSPDGKWFAYYNTVDSKYYQNINLYNFDRCTGQLSNPQQFQIKVTAKAGGVAFSPNSQYLYISSNIVLYQADVNKPFTLNNLKIVGEWDGNTQPHSTTFWMLQLAPDNKIYMNISNSVNTLHVIEEPDKEGLACNFQQNKFVLPVRNITLPNYPYFRLYDWQGSPCDTLGINGASTVATKETDSLSNTVKIYPNPVSQVLRISIPEEGEGKKYQIQIHDLVGRMVLNSTVSGSNTLDMSELNDGIYVCKIYSNEQLIFAQKVIKLK
jgi:Secretion system C-terminal sorting domain/WD40-like Beta Propeller Repeat